MASRLLDRLKRSLFKDGQGAGPEQEAGVVQEEEEEFKDVQINLSEETLRCSSFFIMSNSRIICCCTAELKELTKLVSRK